MIRLGEWWRRLVFLVRRDRLTRESHPDLAETVLEESGYTAMWQADRSADAPGRLENLKELIAALEEFETLPAFLEHVSLVLENTEGPPGEMVSLMTLHSAKGLEFDTVFLPGWEEGLFPHPRALDEGGDRALEEERRLAHVGLTRARRRALVSFAANRRIHNLWQSSIPSRFIAELPTDHVEMASEPGLWTGAAGEEAWGDPLAGTAWAGAAGGPSLGARGRINPLAIEGRAERVPPRRGATPCARASDARISTGPAAAAVIRPRRERAIVNISQFYPARLSPESKPPQGASVRPAWTSPASLPSLASS